MKSPGIPGRFRTLLLLVLDTIHRVAVGELAHALCEGFPVVVHESLALLVEAFR
jgi:hypothetical protein